ncbi:MAG: hypothetical protein M1838_003138 [Thelocarpon superellum]|nr:MAG: hypothetical protein M1838_003138 [Thelocarpon superellum]
MSAPTFFSPVFEAVFDDEYGFAEPGAPGQYRVTSIDELTIDRAELFSNELLFSSAAGSTFCRVAATCSDAAGAHYTDCLFVLPPGGAEGSPDEYDAAWYDDVSAYRVRRTSRRATEVRPSTGLALDFPAPPSTSSWALSQPASDDQVRVALQPSARFSWADEFDEEDVEGEASAEDGCSVTSGGTSPATSCGESNGCLRTAGDELEPFKVSQEVEDARLLEALDLSPAVSRSSQVWPSLRRVRQALGVSQSEEVLRRGAVGGESEQVPEQPASEGSSMGCPEELDCQGDLKHLPSTALSATAEWGPLSADEDAEDLTAGPMTAGEAGDFVSPNLWQSALPPTEAELEVLMEEYEDLAMPHVRRPEEIRRRKVFLAKSNIAWGHMVRYSNELKESGQYTPIQLQAADRSVDWFFERHAGARSNSFDARQVARPSTLPARSSTVVVAPVVHHYNYFEEPVMYRTGTPREVSLWASWQDTEDALQLDSEGEPNVADLRKGVLTVLARRTIDPVRFLSPPDPFPLGNKGFHGEEHFLWCPAESRLCISEVVAPDNAADAPHAAPTPDSSSGGPVIPAAVRPVKEPPPTPTSPSWSSQIAGLALTIGGLLEIVDDWSVFDVIG